MKIIAKTEKGYLLEADKYEIEKIGGENYFNRDIRIGGEVKVSKIYDRLKRIEQGADTINRAAQNLRALADVLETQNPVIEKICSDTEEEERKER